MGGVGFTVGSNVRDARQGFLVVVHALPPFAKERIRSAVVGLEEWAAVVDRYDVPEKPILRFGQTSLTLDYPEGRLDVSKWLENFGAITTAVGI